MSVVQPRCQVTKLERYQTIKTQNIETRPPSCIAQVTARSLMLAAMFCRCLQQRSTGRFSLGDTDGGRLSGRHSCARSGVG